MLPISTEQPGAPENKPDNLSLAYLVGQYPAVSHTFILREVTQLRKLGFDIHVASINAAERSAAGYTAVEAAELEQTFYVKTRRVAKILRDHLACLVRRPVGYLQGLALVVKLANWDLKALLSHFFYFLEAVIVGEWMDRKNLRHIHVHFANATSTVALLASRIYSVRFSITVHGSDEFYDGKFYRIREKINGASFLCCVSNFTRSQLMKFSGPEQWSKLEVCKLGVDPTTFGERQHSPNDTFQLVCTGRLVPAKGQSILLLAVKRLLESGRSVHLHLVGDGPFMAGLRTLAADADIAESVTFYGAVNQERVRSILAKADAFALPSFAEGVPVSLMEAMAMGIPCISTYVGGIPELIESGVSGLLIFPSDPELLADAVEKLAGHPELASRLGQAGRQTIRDSYDLQTSVDRLAGIFQRRLAGPEKTAQDAK